MGKRAVVFVHGHMGRSSQFKMLIEALPVQRSTDLHNLVLPGHESGLQAFAGKSKNDWQDFVQASLMKLRSEYDELILIGHSMGGLLLIQSAVKCPDKIQSVHAIALPLFIKITIRGMMIRLGTITNLPSNPGIAVAKQMSGVSGISFLNSYKLIPNTVGLLRIMKETRKDLPAISVPLTIYNSTNDEIVSMRSIDFVQRVCPKAEIVTLRKASHFDYPVDEIKIIAKHINI